MPAEFHRDLITGAVPGSPNELLDAIEELWRCDDGDITGLTQETVLVNCTGTASFAQSNVDGPDATPGSLVVQFDDITPTADEFHAVQIMWTGQTFDAFSHVAHVAAGSTKAHATGRSQIFAESPGFTAGDWPSWVGPATSRTWGIAIRANGLLFLYYGSFITSDPLAFPPVEDQCWHAQQSTGGMVIDGSGNYRLATIAELRAAGLTVDAIATQQTHEIGLFVMLHRVDVLSGFGAVINPPAPDTVSATLRLDTVGLYAIYTLTCTAAFVNLSTLTASMPDHAGQSNVEPYEMRGMTCSLSLETAPAYDETIHSPILQTVYEYGYFYRGTTTVQTYRAGQGGTPETATVEVWYAPCRQIVCRMTVASVAYDAWFAIDHNDEYSSDACTGSGDSSTGHATGPTFAGLFQRDIRLSCQTVGIGDRLSVPWYGTDCVDRENETSWVNIHGVLGKCQQPMPGEADPVCTTGLNPNQLPQLTDCYSLDPIAIGYRRRITNVFGVGAFGPCGSSYAPYEKSYPNNVERVVQSVVDPFTATSGSGKVTLSLPSHGFSSYIPGSSGIVVDATTRAAFVDFFTNSGLWAPGTFMDWTGFWAVEDSNSISTVISGANATGSGSGGGSLDVTAVQAWQHNCQLDVMRQLGFVGFSLDTVIGVGSQLVAGHLYVDITE